MNIMDTAGQEDYANLRVLSFKNTNCFIVCFSVVDMVTFNNVKASWIPEVRQEEPGAKILLVGTKSDLRGQKKARRPSIIKRTSLRDKEVFFS